MSQPQRRQHPFFSPPRRCYKSTAGAANSKLKPHASEDNLNGDLVGWSNDSAGVHQEQAQPVCPAADKFKLTTQNGFKQNAAQEHIQTSSECESGASLKASSSKEPSARTWGEVSGRSSLTL